MNLTLFIIILLVYVILFAVGLRSNDKQREKEWKKRAREMYKGCTGHYPEEAEAVVKRQAQEFADILKRQDLWQVQFMLIFPHMYHLTKEQAEDCARRHVRRKGLTKEDCVRIGYPGLAMFSEW